MKVPPPRLLLAAAFLLQSLISYRTDATRLSAASSAPSGGAWRNHTEWTRDTVAVDYKGRHPFERGGARRAQRAPAAAYRDQSRYKPMRVKFDTHLLDALVATHPAHVSYVRNVLLPSLRNFWSSALSVIPAARIEVPLDGRCAREVKELSGFDLTDFLQYEAQGSPLVSNIGSDGNVEVGGSGRQSLVYHDQDLVAIVIPVEGTDLCPSSAALEDAEESGQLQTLAFATNCQHDQLDRPTAGYTGICFGPMDPTDRSSQTHQRRLLTVAHEFTHILGMNSYDMPFFYSHATGRPRTPRDARNRPPEAEALCVDGKHRTVPMASQDTVRPVTTANGYVAYEVVTETVVNVVRNQLDCQEAAVAGRLENQPTGDSDCFGSHWDHRLFHNEFMTAVYTGSRQYVTALTLALLEDSGWYRPNYKVAQNSPFALGAGCEFLQDQCMEGGAVPGWARGTFCDSANSIGCTPDKRLVAYCDLSRWDGSLPSGYQYFEDPSIGGGLQQMDFCPAFTTIFRFEVGDDVKVLDCHDSNLNTAWVHIQGEVFGADSRCIEHASGARPLCLEVICGQYGQEAGKVVLVVEGGERRRCSFAGEVVRLPSGADVICPSFEQTCPESICPANCAGRGICDYTLSPARCECFDRSDASPFCSGSPHSFAPTISPMPTESASPTPLPTVSPWPTESPTTSGSPSCCRNYFLLGSILIFPLFILVF